MELTCVNMITSNGSRYLPEEFIAKHKQYAINNQTELTVCENRYQFHLHHHTPKTQDSVMLL